MAEMPCPALLFDHFMRFMNKLLCKLNAEQRCALRHATA